MLNLAANAKPQYRTPLVGAIAEYIENHLLEIRELSELSQTFGYSYSYLSHLFVEETGIPLRDYYSHQRRQKVLELMRSNRYTVTEIAEMMNYRSIHTFSRAFKKAFGVSPTQFIKQYMKA